MEKSKPTKLMAAPVAPKSKAKDQTPKAVEMARRMSRDFQTWATGRRTGAASPSIPAGARAGKTPRAVSDAFGYIAAQNMSASASMRQGMRIGPFVTRTGSFGWSVAGEDDGY